MPVIQQGVSNIGYPSTYPTVEDCMNLARSLVNDTFPGATGTPGEGQILTDSPQLSPFTIPFINSAIRRIYRKLGNYGVASLIQDNYILTNLPPVHGANGVGVPDPAAQVAITFSGYFDGTTLWNAASTPARSDLLLPANTLAVLKMWERTTGTNNPFTEMVQAEDGLPSRQQITYFGDWEWRGGSVTVGGNPVFGDGIYMCGSVLAEDVRLRLSVSLPAAVTAPGSSTFPAMQIPVLDCIDAVANYIAGFYTAARGEDDPDVLGRSKIFMDAGDQYTMEVANRQIRQKQAVPYRRTPYGDSGWGGTGWW